MKNFEKILLVTVFFCILPVANLFALSKEATEAIEAMRARLRLSENTKVEEKVSVNSTDDYIPGRELSEVLARIRRERFESEKRSRMGHARHNSNKIETVPVEVPAEPQEEEKIDSNFPIVADDSQETEAKNTIVKEEKTVTVPTEIPAVVSDDSSENNENYSSQPDNNTDQQEDLIIIEAREAEDSEAWVVPINDLPNQETQSQKPVVQKKSTTDKNEYVIGQLLNKSIKRIRHSQRRNTPASSELDSALEEYEKRLENKKARNSQEVISNANEEIEELFNNTDKYSDIEEKSSSDLEENKIDDDKFNDYISKYDFKMPENYRIIVE